MNYKYRLHYLLRQLSYEDYQIAMKWFPAHFKISISTWHRWIYMKEKQFSDIPATAFYSMAVFFNVPILELFTTPPKDIVSSFSDYKSLISK